jgi:hypothetical protein
MAKKFSELMVEDSFTGLVHVSESGRQRGLAPSVTRILNLMGDRSLSKYRFGAAMEEAATTSDFPILLGMILDQTLLTQYKMILPDWKEYIDTGTQSDFRPSQLVKLWGLEGALPPVAQGGEYNEVYTAEGKVSIQLSKFGKQFGLTWEDVLNDRLGVFTDAAKKLAQSAQRTEYRAVTNLYSSATGPNATLFSSAAGNPASTITHPVDGALVKNSTNLPLTAANLATVIGLIRRQRDVEGEPLLFEKIHVVVPSALDIQLRRILNPASIIVSGGDSTAGAKAQQFTSLNILNQYSIVPHVNPYLDSIDLTANASGTWYVFVDKNDAPAVQFNYLRGHETPEVFRKMANATGVDGGGEAMESFEDDKMWWKVRHVFGGTTIDPRAAYVSVSATVPTS